MQEQLAEVARANELLHSQVQTYGAQIERMQESRLIPGDCKCASELCAVRYCSFH